MGCKIFLFSLFFIANKVGAFCFNQAAQQYGVSEQLLYAVAKQESGLNPTLRSKPNKNGTYDIGLMQINSAHLPVLAKYGITESHLYDPCVSLQVGAWVLSRNMAKYGQTWRAVGAYNAGNEQKRAQYAWKIYGNMVNIPMGASLEKRDFSKPMGIKSQALKKDKTVSTITYFE